MRPVADVRATSRPENNVWLAIAGITPPDWMADALCAETDPESFFPEKGGSSRDAKRICARCTVSAECLTYALDNREHFGIWGGFSERERRRLLGLDAA